MKGNNLFRVNELTAYNLDLIALNIEFYSPLDEGEKIELIGGELTREVRQIPYELTRLYEG